MEVPTREALLASVHENWAHARHQEQLRERHNYLYWASWAAVLAFAGSQGRSLGASEMCPIYLFLTVFSAVVLSTTLKWTAEFTNHLGAVYSASVKLGLIEPEAIARQSPRFRWLASVKLALPYPPFTGYMALPLDMPIFLNVGATMAIVQAVGFTISATLFTYTALGKDYVGLALLVGAVAFVVSAVICFSVMKLTDKHVKGRSPGNIRE